MTTVATICARGGSQGVPRKNIRPLCGKPLIGWTIEQALASPSVDHVFVSTDDPEIMSVAESFGATVPFRRPADLAGPAAGKLPVVAHLVDHVVESGIDVSRVVDLDPTSPLRTVDDIEAAIGLLDAETDVVITGYESDKNPYFNMVEQKPGGGYGLVIPSTVASRQTAPDVYAMNASIYVWHRHTLSKGLWDGTARLYVMPRERSVDIDSELDFRIVELLMSEREEP